ncbi:L-histidine N(alpha)-methyltransferase [Fulvivirga sp. M361]|uniref:L-histidine N(alpha)-methyltransferase n=1 Tax=Fulvivirga sp. M361 TaxID=2594266 RepID=UPI001179D704|nr:L-histidine N(alpha)-methyltransferase [Fulvivirga sp. M361]TRX48587.1 L-histidine N(alpha)-methyltransferase [Fulvivirga sp. M361]
MIEQFARDVLDGLQQYPKTLPSKYFYDKKGDELFQQIMELDEYYLTRCEYEIFRTHKASWLEMFANATEKFNLIEFGAGDGFKTKVLLKHFLDNGANFQYVPIDISGNVLKLLETSLGKEYPDLSVRCIQNDYFKALESMENGGSRNIVLFLGSNIGNFYDESAITFLTTLSQRLKPGDLVLIGFDLMKDPDVILKAYNDDKGVTAAFNFNLFDRINTELEGNFDLTKFRHCPVYDPLTGTTSSYLVSTEQQTIEIMDTAIHFEAWEAIHTEISQKYNLKEITRLAETSGFSVKQNFFDGRRYFVNSVWQR